MRLIPWTLQSGSGHLYLCGKAAFEIGPNISYLGRGLSRDLHCDICDTAIVEAPAHVYIFL